MQTRDIEVTAKYDPRFGPNAREPMTARAEFIKQMKDMLLVQIGAATKWSVEVVDGIEVHKAKLTVVEND